MAVPAIIKKLDPSIYKTAMRAEQLHSVKPIVAYWCNFWAIQQILNNMKKEKESNEEKKKLLANRSSEDVEMVYTWTGDKELSQYATDTMEWMENFKTAHIEEKAVVDPEIAQLYVEQFAQETLDRAQRVVNANKVTATTANTFDAAATFFGLVNAWGRPGNETIQKIVYAKWNARRILKACKDGLDPNDSNPKPGDLPEDTAMQDSVAQDGGAPANAPRRTRRDSAGVSPPHSPASSAGDTEVPGSPMISSVTTFSAETPIFSDFASPTQPSLVPGTAPEGMSYSPTQSLPYSPAAPSSYQPIPPIYPRTFASTSRSAPNVASQPPPPAYTGYGAPPAQYYTSTAGYPPAISYNRTPSPPAYMPPPPAPPPPVDDEAIAAAQKHAKWAISALNFEDVPTAVRELRIALKELGES